MATFYADQPTTLNTVASGNNPQTRIKSNKMRGRIRYAEFLYVAPSSGTAPAIADKIVWGKLPPRSRILNHLSKLYWNAGTASCTLNLGDNVVPARHLAATSVTALGNVVPEVDSIVKTMTGDITIGSTQVLNALAVGAANVGALIVGTGIPTGTTITAVDVPGRVITMSAAATATTATLAITTTGGSYETTDDSNSVANGYASATDDCTLTSVVAGAQVANNQVFTLKVAYVQD